MGLYARVPLELRDNESFWDKHRWLIIGGGIAILIQIVALYF